MLLRFFSFISSCYSIAAFLTLFVFLWIFWAPGFSMYFPWVYGSDGIFASVLIKSIMDTGSYLTNSFLGASGGYQLYDFPINELANFVIIYFETFFSKNYALVLNGFYFLTFLFSAFTSVYVCRRLSLNKAFTLLVSVLFAFSPYHLYRGEVHLFLSAYYAVPIYFLMVISIFLEDEWKNASFFFEATNKHIKRIQVVLLAGIIIFAASSGVYYAFFGCYFLIIAGIFGVVTQKTWMPMVKVAIFIGLIILGCLINFVPSIFAHIQHGPNLETAHRVPVESELYGLKIIQLLLPPDFSGFSFMQTLRENYNDTSAHWNENRFASLGIIGSLGFLFLLFVSLFMRNAHFLSKKIQILATLNLSAVLFATIGGLGTLFAYIIFPEIRAYNRISIFILYFSLIGLALFMQWFVSQYCIQRARLYSWIIAGFLLLFGLYEQGGHYQNHYVDIQQKFQSDEMFVEQIEIHFPNGGNIFQLPYFPFPENGTVNTMLDYDCFRGYLHSHNLHWSSGAMKGRPVAQWQQAVTQKPMSELLKDIILAGFSGLYIDRNGYVDRGQAIEAQLENLLHMQPLISEDGNLVFFDLNAYAQTIFADTPVEKISEERQKTQIDMQLQAAWGKGFYGLESDNQNPPFTWRWSDRNSILYINNDTDKSIRMKLQFQLKTVGENFSHVILKATQFGQLVFSVNQEGKEVALPFLLSPGKNSIYFLADGPRITLPPGSQDMRIMYFQVDNFKFSLE